MLQHNDDQESSDGRTVSRLIQRAREGDQQAFSELMESCRKYLLLVANSQLDHTIRGKVGPSDVVQESLIAAGEQFEKFYGNSQQELLAWLRGIVINGTRNATRHYKGVQKRQVTREVNLNDSNAALRPVMDSHTTPSSQAAKNEESVLLERAISQLPEDYQRVLRLRNWNQLSFPAIATQMDRSPEAVRKLWTRALLQLEEAFQQLCGEEE